MNRKLEMIGAFASVLFLCNNAFGQAPKASAEFDAAVIKLNKSGDAAPVSGGILPGGQISLRNVPLSALLQIAYQVRPKYIVGGPGWFDSDRFDITAKTPPGTPDDKLTAMLQAFLIQEFKMAVHQEQRPMDVFVLTVGKSGPKFQKAAGSGPPDCQRKLVDAEAAAKDADRLFLQGTFQAICKNMTMAALGDTLQAYAPGYVNRAVVDQTGLQGAYDLKLNWAPRTLLDQGGLTMFEAVDKMLGLKLEARKLPMTVVVIDHVEKLSEN